MKEKLLYVQIFFKWDYENWCPIKEQKAEPLF